MQQSTVLTFNQACLTISWSHWLLFANIYRKHFCRRGAELLTWIHRLINADSLMMVLIHKYSTHTHTHSPQTKSTHHLFIFPKDSLSLSFLLSPDFFYLLGGWALWLGLILSCRLEPVPWGQLSANTQQPLSTYSDHGYTLCYTVSTYKPTQQMHTAIANHFYLDCFKQTKGW